MSAIGKFIGGGLVFPIKLNNQGRPEVGEGVDIIRSSILNIINWPKHIKFFNQAYGCDIEEALEEPDDAISAALIKHYITEAIELWEKRVETRPSLIRISNKRDSSVDIQITYIIKNTKTEDTFIYPFYRDIKY